VVSEKRPLNFDDYWKLKGLSDVQLSPDGTSAAYTVGRLDPETDTETSAIWLLDMQTHEVRQFTTGEASDSQPRWSPDGSRLAFVSTRHEGKPQLFVMPVSGGEPHRLTGMELGAGAPAWSPDGRRICFSSQVKSETQSVSRETQWLERYTKLDKTSPKLRRQSTLKSRMDARGYYENYAHLFLIDADATPDVEPRQITEGEHDDTDAQWSPDGRVIGFMSNRTENFEFNMTGDIWTVNPDSGETKRVTNEDFTAFGFTWSPDGRSLSFAGFPEWFTHGFSHSHVYTVPAEGGPAQDISGQLDESVTSVYSDYVLPGVPSVAWSPDSSTVYFVADVQSYGRVFAVERNGGPVRQVTEGEVQVAGIVPAPAGDSLLLLAGGPTRPFDLYTVPTSGGVPAPITNVNADVLSEVEPATPERLLFQGADGWEVEGWLIRPQKADGPVPMILHVHGGPYGSYHNMFSFQFQALAGEGYASLYINPRGSTGYGLAFTKAEGIWGEKDYEDLMAGVDAAIARGGIDQDRLGVTGLSYGGFMTNWIIGHTDRFKAAVSVNGVSNEITMSGISDVCALWTKLEFGGHFWESPEVMQRYLYHSPLTYVGNITTPLLLIQSENDYRCPIEQGEQMLTALRVQDKVVELVRVPNASHVVFMTAAPRHRFLQWILATDWFDRYLKGEGEQEIEKERATVGASVS
jgi:dipeptidyl aminopeptidase/acylaminoacyl peptidase